MVDCVGVVAVVVVVAVDPRAVGHLCVPRWLYSVGPIVPGVFFSSRSGEEDIPCGKLVRARKNVLPVLDAMTSRDFRMWHVCIVSIASCCRHLQC